MLPHLGEHHPVLPGRPAPQAQVRGRQVGPGLAHEIGGVDDDGGVLGVGDPGVVAFPEPHEVDALHGEAALGRLERHVDEVHCVGGAYLLDGLGPVVRVESVLVVAHLQLLALLGVGHKEPSWTEVNF